MRVEERRLKTEADLNSADLSLFTELLFSWCGKGLNSETSGDSKIMFYIAEIF